MIAFAVVALLVGVIAATQWPEGERDDTTQMLQAPDLSSTVTFDATRCDVAPLTADEVYGIVVDQWLPGDRDPSSLLAAASPAAGLNAHMETWLPEADGTVRLVNTTVDVRQPMPVELQAVEASLNRYLRCQDEGTNYHLWALESPVEVQRQILTPILRELEGTNDEITEPMIVAEIERRGPLFREDGQFLTFSVERRPSAINAHAGLRLEANPSHTDAFVARDSSDVPGSYAWIGTQLVDDATREVVLHRGARLDEPLPQTDEGVSVPMVGVFILVQHDGSEDWLVEWFISSV